MSLSTRCPACGTIFRISTAQAAAKGGMVRCGLCDDVFNSLDALVRVEDLEFADEIVAAAPPTAPPEAPAGETVPPTDPAAEARASGEAIETIDATPDPEAAVAEPPAAAVPWWLPEPPVVPPLDETPAATPAADPGDAPDRLVSGRRTDLQWSGAALEGTGPTFMQPDVAAPAGGRAARWGMAALTVVALLGLLVQGVHRWRDELAARWPPARPALAALCVPLRCTVDYPAHLDAIGIESANVQVAGPTPNVYVLTALLRNRDAVDVRFPHLELVLTDLQDRPILRRALRPEDYLSPRRDIGGFAAESELPIRVTFELTDLRFTGYRLERFYP